MSNTLIAWAAFYPVLSAAFGPGPVARENPLKTLIFTGFHRMPGRSSDRSGHLRHAQTSV